MIHVIVSYQVKPEFVGQNKRNIQKFLDDFKTLDNSKFVYNVFLKADGITFMHCSNFADEQIQKQVLNVPSFLEFQKNRDESGLNNSHRVEMLEHVGSSTKIL